MAAKKKSKPTMPKAPKIQTPSIEVEKRVGEIYDLLIVGYSRRECLQYASEKAWGVTERTVDNYIRRAKDIFRREAKYIREMELGRSLARLDRLFKSNMKIQDFKAALATLKERNTMLGLYEPVRHEIKHEDWRSRVVEEIKDGRITYEAIRTAFDESLADELFRLAGKKLDAD